ncbi:WG repeat-containing protein [Paenibacillus sp. MMS20-IR301]|uniref:WG repeat-containing protein n=1 Tax=Paenibacillus sp. MMS20-IR301 TaxID=2895946 RepID=UPI0028E7B0DA|nr:WG repeat-containing protein [Paenibacillus sp. MMS20-IR301]WNS42906.1 WG repeat-containing protein [Paenibacillus sp. MMS20-IR301]
MKKANRMLLGLGFVILLLISWAAALGSESDADKQSVLIRQAEEHITDKEYIVAVPLLEEAAGYNASHTLQAENLLKEVYLQLFKLSKQYVYSSNYSKVLEKQMGRSSATPEVFKEAAEYELGDNNLPAALAVLKQGVLKTGSEELTALYEENRYAVELGRSVYEEVTATSNGKIQVRREGLWGLANAAGNLVIPCEYDKISTFSTDRAFVKKDGEVYGIDNNNNRLILLHEEIADFGNFGNERIPLRIGEEWRRANGEFTIGSTAFEAIGMYSNGYAAAKVNGKWGVVDTGSEWLVPAEYDEIITDELGRSYFQNAVFASKSGAVYLIVDGKPLAEAYEDARPFSENGYAAVKKNGQWQFIDTEGKVQFGQTFDDAYSFSQHLAAVKVGEQWGYISLSGKVVIEPQYLGAKSFADGSAPVKTESGWQFITLLEYEEEVSL